MRILEGSAFAAPSAARLAEFQNENGIVLPPDYLAFLRYGNAARLITRAFRDGRRERLVIRMLGIFDDYRAQGADGFADIEVVMSQIGTRLSGDMHAPYVTLVPIAELFAGDFLCLDFRASSSAPAVALWDHERSDDFRPLATPVAAGFAAFKAMLFEPESAAAYPSSA